MSLVEVSEGAVQGRLARDVAEEEELKAVATWIAATAVFTCFAIRNASPHEATEPRWLASVKQLAEELARIAGIADADFSHLEQDWEEAQRRWQQVIDKLRPSQELDRALQEEPASRLRAVREAEARGGSESLHDDRD